MRRAWIVLALLVVLGGCKKVESRKAEATLKVEVLRNDAWIVTETFCDRGNRVYQTYYRTYGVAIAVVPRDATCPLP